MSDQKWYCGSGKEIDTQYGPFHSITLNLTELGKAMRAGFGFKNRDGDQMIKVNLNRRQQPSEKGQTHYVTLDKWKPDQNRGGDQGNQDSGYQGYQNQQRQQNSQQQQNSGYQGQRNDRFEDDPIPF